ncbi:hypothetical protein HYH03_014997 [Edaphochlamys debaryana]|uniref:Uncharacterized protein n=1 Tax=Edaphochlamys debaryana TaxID=47281 RepID=A0A835XMY9_9CHLO|nr:hypothetical protein HYH03_014997 [Edaphochlamys debaryana]|eukprot:KAG2486292.1 hypothetical protein HYH03_014997 [Edaphochlamys debaryana]
MPHDRLRLITWLLATLTWLVAPGCSAPATFDVAAYDAIHPRLSAAIKARSSGTGCGDWYQPYARSHAAVRSGAAPGPRYVVMVSEESGLADRLTCSLPVLLYALLTGRAFEYVWYGNHVLWESMQSPYIDWRAPVPPGIATRGTVLRDANGVLLPVVFENHFWAQPGRSQLMTNHYLDPSNHRGKIVAQQLFGDSDLVQYGAGYDVILWKANNGMLRWATQNPYLTERLKALNLSLPNAVRCLFNFAYVPSPAALAPWRASEVLDKLLDPDAFVIGIQIRVGDHVFISNRHNITRAPGMIQTMAPYFYCARQLTEELEALPDFASIPAIGGGSSTYGGTASTAAGGSTRDADGGGAHGSSGAQHSSRDWASHLQRMRREHATRRQHQRNALHVDVRHAVRHARNQHGAAGLRGSSHGSDLTGPRRRREGAGKFSTGRQLLQSLAAASSALGGVQQRQPEGGEGDPQEQRQQRKRKVYWLLVSDSAALRRTAVELYGSSGRLLVAEGLPIDHVQDHSYNGQAGLHAAAAELWLYGQANIHVVTVNSAYGRLGALAGPGEPYVYGVLGHSERTCRLGSPDSMDTIAGWWVGVRRSE